MNKYFFSKLNLVDLTIISVLLLIVLWFIFGQVSYLVSPHNYPGTAIYTTVDEINDIMSQGFMVILHVKGKWTGNGSFFDGEGVVAKTAPGSIYLIYRNQTITVGGPASYLEDVAAENLEVKGASKSVIKVRTHLLENNTIDGLVNTLSFISREIAGKYGVSTYKITGVLILTVPNLKPNPYIYQSLVSEFEEAPLTGEVYFVFSEGLISAYFKDWRENEIYFLQRSLDKLNISYKEVLTNRLLIYIGTEKAMSPVRGYKVIHENLKNVRGKVFTDQIKIVPSLP